MSFGLFGTSRYIDLYRLLESARSSSRPSCGREWCARERRCFPGSSHETVMRRLRSLRWRALARADPCCPLARVCGEYPAWLSPWPRVVSPHPFECVWATSAILRPYLRSSGPLSQKLEEVGSVPSVRNSVAQIWTRCQRRQPSVMTITCRRYLNQRLTEWKDRDSNPDHEIAPVYRAACSAPPTGLSRGC